MNKLKIDVLANDGSPLGVSEQSIHGHDGRLGVGGAELAILTLMRGWHDAGHEVTFYNNPLGGRVSKFRQAPISLFHPKEDRDILIIFRSPNHRIRGATGKKIWFSTDQYTVGDFRAFAKEVDSIVTISEFHADYFRKHYSIHGTNIIDLPVRLWEYELEIPKIKNSLIFCSVPERGLSVLADCYDRIYAEVPDISLTITSDYRLWGNHSPLNEHHIRRFLGKSGVKFLGAVPREQLIHEQLAAEIHAYPCTYDELFCYASAECQVAGCLPITSNVGALSTTNMGYQISGNPDSPEWKDEFVKKVVYSANHREESRKFAEEIREKAVERFSLSKILKKWDKVFYG